MSTITVAAEDLRRALDQVLRAVSTALEGGVLRGVLVEASASSLSLVATHKHRLVVSDVPVAVGAGTSFSAVLDAEALADLRDNPPDGDVVLSVHAGVASVAAGGRSLEVAVLKGDFPDHHAVLSGIADDENDVALVADQAVVIDALEELPDDEPLRVQLKPGALEIGQLAPIALDATYDGPAASLFVEPAYLYDAVVAAPGPDLAIEAVDATSPIVVRTPGDHSYLAVVMPILVSNAGSRKH